jgi:hypothetical protein
MANNIKTIGGGLALQVTLEVRAADLVEENPPENPNENDSPPYPTYRADVRVHAFEDLLLVVDRDPDRVKPGDVAELVASAARDTRSAFDARKTRVQIQGHGYPLQLPPAKDAGFRKEHTAPVATAPGVLAIHKKNKDAARLAEDLVKHRRGQVEKAMNH